MGAVAREKTKDKLFVVLINLIIAVLWVKEVILRDYDLGEVYKSRLKLLLSQTTILQTKQEDQQLFLYYCNKDADLIHIVIVI